jgi:hypothetical protein
MIVKAFDWESSESVQPPVFADDLAKPSVLSFGIPGVSRKGPSSTQPTFYRWAKEPQSVFRYSMSCLRSSADKRVPYTWPAFE